MYSSVFVVLGQAFPPVLPWWLSINYTFRVGEMTQLVQWFLKSMRTRVQILRIHIKARHGGMAHNSSTIGKSQVAPGGSLAG